MSIRVLIADDSKIVRKGLRAFLDQTEDIQVVGEAGDGEEAVHLAELLLPDVLLLDVKMPKIDGIQVLWHLRKSTFPGKILAMSASDDYLQNLHSMLNNGANGYLTKQDSSELIQAIRSVVNEEKEWISPRLRQSLSTDAY